MNATNGNPRPGWVGQPAARRPAMPPGAAVGVGAALARPDAAGNDVGNPGGICGRGAGLPRMPIPRGFRGFLGR